MEILSDIISEHHSRISLKWIESKRKEFLNYRNEYDKETDSLIFVQKTSSRNYYDDTEEILEDTKIISFPQFCASYQPINELTYWGEFPIDENDFNLSTISSDLIRDIARAFFKTSNTEETIKIIHNVIEIVEKLNNQKFSENKNSYYAQVIERFLEILTFNLDIKYSIHNEIYTLTNNFSQSLVFNLNQEDFAALLFILEESGILDSKKSKKIPYLNFCANYFKHLNKKNQPVRIDKQKLSDKISDIKGGRGGKGTINIKKKLMVVLKNINDHKDR